MSAAPREGRFDDDYASDIEHLGHERGYIEFERVVAVARMVDKSGALELVAAERAKDRRGKGPGGRKAFVTDRAILTLLMLLALEHEAMHITLVRYIVTNRLRKESLNYLDIKMGDATEENIYHRLAAAFQRFNQPVNPYPGGSGKRMTYAEHLARQALRDPIWEAVKNDQLHAVANSFVTSSVAKMPQAMRECFQGNYAVDATFIKSQGKRGTDKINGRYVSCEPDGGRYFRKGNHGSADNPQADKKKSKKANIWGFELATVTMIGDPAMVPAAFPQLIAAVAWDAPSGQPGQNALAAFKAVVEYGLPLNHVAADRAYYAGAAVDNFHEQMFDWGAKPVTDYKVDQLGNKAQCQGAIQVEGTWYCPSMPKGLINATKDVRSNKIDEETYRARIAARVQWAAIRKSRPDKDGTTRWSHPTGLGDRCKGEDKFCTQKTISQPKKVGLKYAQEYAYQSDEWRAHYPLRNAAESTNASLKRASTHGLGDPERRRLRTRSAQFILAAMVTAAMNIKKIRDFDKSVKRRTQKAAIKANRQRVPFGYTTMNDDERAEIDANHRE